MSDSINEIKPGVPVTDEQKKALAKSNAESTAEAQRLAAEHRARDVEEGKGEPAVATVANIIKGKLEREEFQPNDRGAASIPAEKE